MKDIIKPQIFIKSYKKHDKYIESTLGYIIMKSDLRVPSEFPEVISPTLTLTGITNCFCTLECRSNETFHSVNRKIHFPIPYQSLLP